VSRAAQSRRVVSAAVAANAALAVAKFIVAAISGSSAILSEGIHSIVDTLNECLLMLGLRRSRRAPDVAHPFGHGKELYFWGLIVAVLLFGVGGGMAIYEGIAHLRHPQPTQGYGWTCLVLGLAAVFEGSSFAVAYRALGAQRDAGNPTLWWRRIRRSKDPSVFIVFLEDLAALVGIVIAFIGVTLGVIFHNPYFDGVASLLIGAVLATVAIALAHETRKLLVGETAPLEVVRDIRELMEREPDVRDVDSLLTMQLGPDEILVIADVGVRDGLTGQRQVELLEGIERQIRARHGSVKRIALQPRGANSRRETRARQAVAGVISDPDAKCQTKPDNAPRAPGILGTRAGERDRNIRAPRR
jgi:cation diffusion facilitator family transporter